MLKTTTPYGARPLGERAPASWYLISGEDNACLRIGQHLVVGLNGDGELVLGATDPSLSWLEFCTDGLGQLRLAYHHPELALEWPSDLASDVDDPLVLAGTVFELAGHEMYFGQTLKRGSVRYRVSVGLAPPLVDDIVVAEPSAEEPPVAVDWEVDQHTSLPEHPATEHSAEEDFQEVVYTEEPPILRVEVPATEFNALSESAEPSPGLTEPLAEVDPLLESRYPGPATLVVPQAVPLQPTYEQAPVNDMPWDSGISWPALFRWGCYAISGVLVLFIVVQMIAVPPSRPAATPSTPATDSNIVATPPNQHVAAAQPTATTKTAGSNPKTVPPATQTLVAPVAEALEVFDIDVALARARQLIQSDFIVWPEENAVSLLSEVFRRQPNNPTARTLLDEAALKLLHEAHLAYRDGFTDSAYNLVNQVLQFHPKFSPAQSMLERWQNTDAITTQ